MSPAISNPPPSSVLGRLHYKAMRLRLQIPRYAAYCKEAGPRWVLMFASSRLSAVRAAVAAAQRPPNVARWRGQATLFATTDPARFADKVSTAMTGRIDTVGLKTPVSALIDTFNKGHVAIVVDQGRFFGLITRMDVLNHLRNKAH